MPGKLEESVEERERLYELPSNAGTKKSQSQVSKNAKGRNLREKKRKNNHEVKGDVKEIQKTVSCVFETRPDSKKNDKIKKSDSERGKNAIGSSQKKKHKSWEHFKEIKSKESLAQRVSDALAGTPKKDQKSEVDCSTKEQEEVGNRKVNNQTKFKANFKRNWSNEQKPEQSLSFQYLELTKKAKELCKSLSLETGTNKQHDPGVGSIEHLKDGLCKPEATPKHEQLYSTLGCRADSSELLSQAPESSLRNKPSHTYTFKPTLVEAEKVTNKSSESVESEKGRTKKHRSHATGIKNNIKICYCPHFHTDDRIKKICLQGTAATEEYGRKFFRVNYISKEKSDKSFTDKGTTTEEEVKKKKLKRKTAEENKTNKLGTQKSKEENSQNKPKQNVSPIKKYMQILENAQKSKKKVGNETKDTSAAKEVEKLRQLFNKLNSVERLLNQEKYSENSTRILRNYPNLLSSNLESKQQQDNLCIELKSKILQHFNKWLDLEYNTH